MKYSVLFISVLVLLTTVFADATEEDRIALEEQILERDNIPGQDEVGDVMQDIVSIQTKNETNQSQDNSNPIDQIPEQTAQARTVYITDEFYVPVRSIPDINGRVVHRGLKTGTRMQHLLTENEWSRVRTKEDLEGWIQSRYITSEPISRTLLEDEKKVQSKLKEYIAELEIVATAMREENANLSSELEGLIKRLETEKTETQKSSNQTNVADVLNNQMQSLVSKNNLLTQENDVLKARLNNFEKDDLYRSFLYGGLSVFLGAILAALVPRLRGRKRFGGWD